MIQAQAVALRLQAGSDEAGYLAQIFPLPQTPTVVIIKNGELKEYLVSGVSKEDFIRRIHAAFNAQPQVAREAASQLPSTSAQSAQPAQPEGEPSADSAQTSTSENVRRILAERAARLEIHKAEQERKLKEERARAKEKAKAEAVAGADTEAARAHQQAELVRKKKKQDEEERKRILKRIADDKAERRERAAEKKKAREEGEKKNMDSGVEAPASKLPTSTKLSDMTALQVRLFDGSTMRSRFKTNATLKDVRKWVDDTRHDGSLPYTFKQVLTPLPNKNIDTTEESKGLGELGLAPSSTLVLIPVHSYAGAYEGASGNLLMRFLRLIIGFFTWIFGSLGFAGTRALDAVRNPEAPEQQTPAMAAAQGGSRVQGFQNQSDRRRDQQFYNGNSVSLLSTSAHRHGF